MATIEPNFESICINPNDDLVLYKKEIVRSRIEKFLYAICSLDTDDLPTPLSRIEELYNCLVTGEDIPTFTPLSRAEKFVMAMLGAYDVELLPTPISRSETLMKKIATGDNNLDDVDNLQSRYEFLLAYIIKAGGFNGGSPGDSGDFYYKLTSLTSGFTTIYDTLDMPVKNAVLRGNTLVNVGTYKTNDDFYACDGTIDNDSYITITAVNGSYKNAFTKINSLIKPSTKYLIVFDIAENTLDIAFAAITHNNNLPSDSVWTTDGGASIPIGAKGVYKFIRTTKSDLSASTIQTTLRSYVNADNTTGTYIKYRTMIIEYQDGMENWDIPYFTGMQSVKMPVLTTTGKNLFDSEFKLSTYSSGKIIIPNGIISSVSFPYTTTAISRGIGCITQVKPNTNYTISIVDKQQNTVLLGDGYNNLNDISSQTKSVLHVGSVDNDNHTTLSFTTPSNCNYMIIGCYIKYSYAQSGGTITFNEPPKIQLEENSVSTSYEPHKSNILTCNEEVELRGIGDIKDELILVTGELTQRIQERVFDGSENWIIGGTGANYIMFRCENYTDMVKSSNVITCDKYAYNKLNNATSNLSVTNSTTTGKICIVTSQKDLSIDNFKAKLNTDKPTIQYQLAEPIVKTVDISTLDQDGKETELSTFDDITHVTTSSKELAPTGDILTSRPIYFMNYLIDNGLTTFENTVYHPVKNAVLRGQTLVNLASLTGATTLKPGDVIFIENTGMKTNTTYTIMFNCSNIPSTNFVEVRTMMDNTQITQVQQKISVGYNKFTIKTNTSKESNRFRFKNDTSATTDFIFGELVILEGDYTNENIPYFEGIASVKMPVLTTTGKNLYNKTPFNGFIDSSNGKFVYNNSTTRKISDYIEVKSNATYKVSGCTMTAMWGYDKDKNPVSAINIYTDYITTTNNMRFIAFNIDSTLEHSNIQIEDGTVATLYEPHKSTTVLCNEDVELRSIGDIKDELNLVTGELTQRVGEVVLDGSENWSKFSTATMQKTNTIDFITPNSKQINSSPIINDRLPALNEGALGYLEDKESISARGGTGYYIWVSIQRSRLQSLDAAGFKQWLSSNPITVQYIFNSESVKTVDLSVVDQDDKETELSTFDDITHVITSSEGLVPTGDIDIARPIQFVDYSLDNSLTPLYNTIDYPVKNAVLRGQTLVNLASHYKVNLTNASKIETGFKFNATAGTSDQKMGFLDIVKPNTYYTYIFTSDTAFEYYTGWDATNGSAWNQPIHQAVVGLNVLRVKTEVNTTKTSLVFRTKADLVGNKDVYLTNFMILEGDYTNVDIPYFTGMQSVKMPVLTTTGKNLFDGELKVGGLASNGAVDYNFSNRIVSYNFIPIKNNMRYKLSSADNLLLSRVCFYDNNKQIISESYTTDFISPTNAKYLKFAFMNTENIESQLMLEEGSTASTYEPYKSNTVSCNEEVELCRIGDIKDELNLVTGEYTKVIHEYTFTGDENWKIGGGATGGYTYFNCNLSNFMPNYNYKTDANIPIHCNRLPVVTYNDFDNGLKNVGINLTYFFRLNFSDCNSNNGATVEDLKAYLKANPTTIYYPISKSVKTVDLSTLDQDGKETELSTFDDITHVIASSEELVPTGEITVATKNATDVIDASAMSLRMNNILNSQGTLEGSANTQSDDIDVTMLGATDIYEQLL